MRVTEDSSARYVLGSSALGQIFAALILGGLGMLVAALSVDALTIECDRAKDQCDFASIGVLQGGRSEGTVRLSQVGRWRTESFTQRGSRNSITRKERHELQLVDGRRVEVEPRHRSVMFDDLLPAQFEAFRRSSEPSLRAFALHFGYAGFVIAPLLALALVLLVLAEQKQARFDFATGSFAVTARGLRSGRRSTVGAIRDLVAVETLAMGTQAGTYLALRDGRRATLQAGAPSQALGAALAARLALPLARGDAETIRRAGEASRWLPALGCMLLALSPLVAGIAWWIVNSLWGSLL